MYGVRIEGLDACECFGSIPSDWPEWRVTAETFVAADHQSPGSVGPERGLLRFGDGSIARVERREDGGSIHVQTTQVVAPCLLAHPYLGPVGVFSSYWTDRLPLHAGAVDIGGAAWLVLATKSGGKSTTLALLDRSGHAVLADDLSIIDPGMNVHRGPRFIDLRRDAAQFLGIGTELGVLGTRERWRHPIGDAPLTLPLGGIIATEWGEPGIEAVRGAARFETVGGSIALGVRGPWDELFMDIVTSVPLFVWRRPQNLVAAGVGIEQLVDHIVAVS
jgi:hypothetical protein